MKQYNLSINVGNWQASLQVNLWEGSQELMAKQRPMILICPGGGYRIVSDREADPVAAQFFAMGYHTAVLRYSVSPARYPTALLQLAGAVKLIRENAAEWMVDSKKILVNGYSAGGHLAASLGVFWKKEILKDFYKCDSECFRPNGLILSYPVISSGEFAHRGSFEKLLGEGEKEPGKEMSLEMQVNKDVPITFLWHTDGDDTVPVENSVMFYSALHREGIPAELHIFQKGGHGLSTADKLAQNADGYGIQPECQCWIPMVHTWIESNFGK
ncbi:MAG: alpha/beta hydrolase [Eubacteriales bacterium]|nr:alpha/beta hydrolase [Eubacteriales bacterium]